VADPAKIGRPWSDDELDAIVADHFAMLRKELAGEPYVKSHHAQVLMAEIGRTHRSVEFKHMNLSAVLAELGLPTIRGYRPKPNYQAAIFPAIDRYLSAHPEWTSTVEPILPRLLARAPADGWKGRESAPPFAGAADNDSAPLPILLDPEPPLPATPPPRPPGLERLVRKFDPVARDARNRALGKVGEELVIEFERRRLELAGRKDLASKVRWVAQEDGDGAGYDVHSFNQRGEDRLIEVKTTRGVRTTPFFISRNELSLAQERPEHFRLYRLYEVAQSPRSFVLKPPLDKAASLEPETWRARVG